MSYVSKKQIILTILIMIFIGVVIFAVYFYVNKTKNDPVVENGYYIFDYDNDPVFLNGEWKFFWDELYNDKDDQSIERMVDVPRMWTFYKDEQGNNYPKFGTATYEIMIDGVEKGRNIAFRFPTFGTSANVYANRELIHKVGAVSKNKDEYYPQYKVEYVTYTPNCSSIDLVIEVSNYSYSRGGVWLPIMIGTETAIKDYMLKKASYDYFLIGIFFITFIAGVTLIIIRPKDISAYFFIAFVILFVLYNSCSGDKIIVRWFSDISMDTIVRLQYLTMHLLPFIWFMYLYIIQKNIYPKLIYIVLGAQSVMMSLFSLFSPIPILTSTTYYANALVGLYFVLAMFASIILTMKRNKNGIVFLVCTLLVGISGLHDVLYGNAMVHSNIEIFGAGYMFSLLTIGVSIIYKATIDMEKAKYSSMYEQAYLNAQIKPHFLFNTLNTISSFIATDSKKASELNFYLAQFLRSIINVDNLKNTILLQKEIENTKAYINIEEARFNNLVIEFYMDNMERIFIPPLTIQPLIENSIKHGLNNKKGERLVIISGEKKDNYYKITVYDNGVGISEDRLIEIKQRLNKKTNRNQLEEFGIGLINVNNRLKRYLNTSLKIESEKGEYTSISFKIY